MVFIFSLNTDKEAEKPGKDSELNFPFPEKSVKEPENCDSCNWGGGDLYKGAHMHTDDGLDHSVCAR